ncbi:MULTISPECIES: HU family DNA-binding protein [unclassified Imperialibacter]|uniref:HU family DNA-binding protein n=1 Tax=unclassified Imperialibacter TaxID=2629706 RepID=UPI001255E9F8|nr:MULTISPECIES: HU family DNA-binding protein [unclassified Imperialibacter]CAD5277577.1 DNA-binding protein [Imperialibacter sp. 75]CAD5295464.1 DNA-binding protein [Imperialibacter sp. 89]VVT12035.1 putative DNA-binding protein, histone-like [Imperialibacter sp. EC-SDR9]
MSIAINIVGRKNPIDQSAPAKFYAVVNATGEVNQRGISQEIAERSTVTPTDSMAVVEALLTMIPKMLADGKIVRLGDLGTFYTSVKSQGAATPEEFKKSNILATTVRFKPGKIFMRTLQAADFKRINNGTMPAEPNNGSTP